MSYEEQSGAPDHDASPPTTPPASDMPSAPAEAAAPAEALVEVENLTKHYGAIRAVDGISFSVRRGDILGFMGPNGAGKTTAMRLITGFLRPDDGRVRVCGHDLENDSLAARQRIGYLPENAPAYGEMTVTGFLTFIAQARAVASPESAMKKVIDLTDLRRVQHQTIETLSKGYKRRVGLAQALIHDPEVLILDEPTDGLDPNQKAAVQELISSLSAEKCIILSTHILDEVERVCNRAMIISQGKLLVDSTPAELVERAPDHNAVHLTLGRPAPELIERLREQPWCETVVEYPADDRPRLSIHPADQRSHLSEILTLAEGVPLEAVHQQEGRLDQLFRDLTQGASH